MTPNAFRNLLALVTAAVACGAPKGDTARGDATSQAAQGAPFDGTWRSEGYGLALAVRGDSLLTYEVTETTCVPATTLMRARAKERGGDVVFSHEDNVVYVRAGAGADSRRLHNDGAASDIILRRAPSLPATCDKPTPDTPLDNFEVFTRTWAEHYILFDEKKVDWDSVTALARTRVTPKTTPQELFAILSGMIAPLHDAHTFIQATSIKESFRTLREGTDRVVKHGMKDFREKDIPVLFAPTDKMLRTPLRPFCNGMLQWAMADDSSGYLRILGESGYTKEGGFAEGLVALEAALDTIFTTPRLAGLVIDVRINFGGADPYGLALASRLATAPWVAYSKEARADAKDRTKWTPGQASEVKPSSRPGFKGPVVELTGPLTISAGETTTQALMGRTPKVLRIGEHTQGVFSDVLARSLPNGWRFGLPNEVFRAADGKTFDGPGIPPDVEVPVFADADVKAGRDPGLRRALAEMYAKR